MDAETNEMERQADLMIMRHEVTDLREAFREGWREAMGYRNTMDEVANATQSGTTS